MKERESRRGPSQTGEHGIIARGHQRGYSVVGGGVSPGLRTAMLKRRENTWSRM